MKRAMLIASSEFSPDSGIEPLRFPLNDVAALEVTLRSDDFGFEVEKLINVPQSVAAEKLEAWISKADYDDLMLIYFSGHGKLSRARELFLTCANTKSTSLIATGLKYTLLTDLIREHSLQKVTIILDCCYAGRAVEGQRGDARDAVEEKVRELVDPGSGIFFLGASGKNQTAEEREIDGHGRLTKQIIEGLSSGDADIDGDGNISAKDLSTYVKQQFRKQHADQEPIEAGAYQGELILGSNRRKQIKATVAAITARIQVDRNLLKRQTRHNIENYVEDIDSSEDIKTVVSDPRYLVLKEYVGNGISLEQVIRVFWDNMQDAALKPPTKANVASPQEGPPGPAESEPGSGPPPAQPPERVATAAKPLVDQEERVDHQSAGTRWLSEQNLRRKAEAGLRAGAEQEVRDRTLRGAVLMVLIAVLGLICLGVAVWCGGSVCWAAPP